MNLSEEQILALAPDDSSRKSGKGLARPGDWVSSGADETAIWGECQGSGSKPYQTQVDAQNIAFKCTCPSRKFPCKHGLGLLLLRAKNPALFAGKEQPEWVKDWIGKRNVKAEKAADPASAKPVDEVAQAKRQQARNKKVTDGVEELLLWLKDIVRNGLIAIPGKEGALQNMGKRMVDAQAGGMAGIIKSIEDINFYADGWQGQFLDKLTTMYLVISAYKNIDALPAEMQQEIRSLIGFSQSLDDIKAQPGIKDEWLVLGRQIREDDQLTIERNWLYGLNTRQHALILNFMVNNQVKALPLALGSVMNAELVFFNHGMSLRALILNVGGYKKAGVPAGLPHWRAALEAQAAQNEKNPFTAEQPFIVEGLAPVMHNGQWWLRDAENDMMQAQIPDEKMWRFLAMTGGQPGTVSLVGKENVYVPLGAWVNDEYKIIVSD